MSAPTRFLAVAVAGWVTFRAAASVLPLPALALPEVAPAAPAQGAGLPTGGEAPLGYAPLPSQVSAGGDGVSYPGAPYAMAASYPAGPG